MERFEHGGDVWRHPGALDFSANLNPLGMPDGIVAALREDPRVFEAYPDPECRELVAGIAGALDVPRAWVLATAGATDLMSRACLALHPERVLVTAPCYSGYEQAVEQAGARVVRRRLRADEGFAVGERFVADAARLGEGDLVILATPNNPTGVAVPLPLVQRVVDAAARAGAVVLLDECFLDLAGAASKPLPSAVGLCDGHPNLVVMRAFTKTYATAGLRLGYGVCSDAALIGRIAAAGQPWAVSTPAQIAGLAALDAREAGYVERSRSLIADERAWLASGLAEEPLGYRVVPGQANYLLFDAGRADLYARLLEQGILVRRCGNYEGLGATWYRVAVRVREENERLLAALRAAGGGRAADLGAPGASRSASHPKGET